MLTKIYKIIFICLIFFNQSNSYSKSLDSDNFSKKNLYNYISALVSLDNNQNSESLIFFNSSKQLKESHESYLKKYLIALILNGKINKAVQEIKTIKNKKNADFFESQLLLVLDSLKKNDFKKSSFYINKLKQHQEEGTFEFIISSGLEEYVYLFYNNKINNSFNNNFGNLSIINKALQNCYLEKEEAALFFEKIINLEKGGGYSRYLFFYLNFLLNEKKFAEAQAISQTIDPLNTTLLVGQAKKWMDGKKFDKFKKIFSCEKSNDIIAEFLYLISHLYSSEGDLKKSNFYFNLSQYFNPKFKFNLSLLAENYLTSKDFDKSQKILKTFKQENEVYHWYKIKKIAEIINLRTNSEESFDYINSQFVKIKNPSLKMIFEMGNIVKRFEKYDLSVKYYSKTLSELDPKTLIYAEVLFRRGGSYERIHNYEKSDEDLLQSLEINPDEPHVLNYLAYSWLERNYQIDEAIQMLEKAYEQKQNDPYIIDSIGWAYYLIGDYIKAERFLRKAVSIMPTDPIVNDHYGDILWKLEQKIQASYFWKNVLTFEDTDNEMKEEIYYKLLKGPKKT